MQPAPGEHEEMDKWYLEEHLPQATTQPGWKRTVKYKLIFQVRNDPIEGPQNSEAAPENLVLYEWEKGFLGKEVMPFDPVTEWTVRICSRAARIEAGNFELVGSWGVGES
jgi:hypothetical protein